MYRTMNCQRDKENLRSITRSSDVSYPIHLGTDVFKDRSLALLYSKFSFAKHAAIHFYSIPLIEPLSASSILNKSPLEAGDYLTLKCLCVNKQIDQSRLWVVPHVEYISDRYKALRYIYRR